VQPKLLDHIIDMLAAPNTAKWRYAAVFQILSHLVSREPSAVAVVKANILNSVEKLLSSRPTDLYKHIFPILESLASHESTAMTVIHMLPLDLLGTLWWYVSLHVHISSEVYRLI
jgi:hypothetical protein